MPVKVNIRHLEADDVHLKGEMPLEDLEFDHPDELVHVGRPVKYDLNVQKTGHAILIQGKLTVVLDCECARCLKPFKQTVKLDNIAIHIPLEGEEKAEIKDDSVDLTPYVREDILLELPQQPLCEADCAGLTNRAEKNAKKTKGASQTPESSVWSELNKLKF